MRAELVVVDGPASGVRHVVWSHQPFLIGRASDAHLVLPPKAGASRFHCLIEIAPPFCHLLDLSSMNGTRVGGRPVERAVLDDGDRIQVGRSTIEVRLEIDLVEERTEDRSFLDDAVPFALDETPAPGDPDDCPACQQARGGGGPGLHVPGYTVLSRLGDGSQGAVYLARADRGQPEPVAIKVLGGQQALDRATVAHFLRENDLLRSIRHPRLVRNIDRGRHGGFLYQVLDYVPGSDLDVYRRRSGGRLDPAEACNLIGQALDGLAHLHEAGIVHRDVKPSNLLLRRRRKGVLEVVVTDFGLAKVLGQTGSLTAEGALKGTLRYMSPDQILDARHARPGHDVYAAGVTLYRLLTGADPYRFVRDRSALRTILEDDQVPLGERMDGGPAGLEEVVMRSIERDPARRYPSAGPFRDALVPHGRPA